MGPEGLREVLGERVATLTLRPARLEGWRRVWNVYRPECNGAVLNVEPSRGDTVVGMLIEGLRDGDLLVLDAREATHLPRESVYVVPLGGEVVAAQMYHRRRGNHTGRPAGSYKALLLERAYRAGWEVYESVCRGSVDAAGQPLIFG
jgi:hypothetical protein